MWRARQIALRLIITLVAGSAVLFVLLGVVANWQPLTKTKAPSVTEAPWVLQTSSRIYLAAEYSVQDGVPAIRKYWSIDGKRYIYHEAVKTFPSNLYGKVNVIRRKPQ
jgi:hypothetical protein